MEQLFDLQVAAIVAILAGIMMKFWQVLKDRLGARWTNASDEAKEYAGYAMMFLSMVVVLLSGLDMAPGLNVTFNGLGRLFTCLAGGLGPSFIYDALIDFPTTDIWVDGDSL